MAVIFIGKEDYKGFVDANILDQIIDSDDSVLEDCEGMASGFIISNLGQRYNLTLEFNQSGSNRNQTLKRWMLSLSVYHIYNTVPDTEIPERVEKNYDDVRAEIMKISAGKASTDLSLLAVSGKSKTRFKWGSNPKRSHNPY